MGKGERCAAPIGFEPTKRDVIATTYDFETERGQRAQHPLKRSVYWELGHTLAEGRNQPGTATSVTNASRIGPSSAGASDSGPNVST